VLATKDIENKVSYIRKLEQIIETLELNHSPPTKGGAKEENQTTDLSPQPNCSPKTRSHVHEELRTK
jgi:hypothetical protein